jgi:hypothetical protein
MAIFINMKYVKKTIKLRENLTLHVYALYFNYIFNKNMFLPIDILFINK